MHTFTDRAYAEQLDAEDELGHFRDEFVISDPDLIYMDGNSLGRLPKRTIARMKDTVESEWGRRLIRGWGEGWFTAPQRVGGKIAQLIGARAEEVLVTDSTSVNFYKLVMAALTANRGRRVIVTDDLNFPSDVYLLQGIAQALNCELRIMPSKDGLTVSVEELAEAIDASVALVTLSHVEFKSGQLHDMAVITELAHRASAWVLWDLSHSAGAVPVALNECHVDLAVGCSYKYLNGGPGAPAFLYVRADLQEKLNSPIWGWFGQKNQFEMTLDYRPAPGLTRFLAGTPTMLSLAAVEPGVELLLEAGIERLRAKSLRQTEYLIALWEALLHPLGVSLNSPRDSANRGSHVSLGHPEGLRIDRALIEVMNVIPDFRFPDNIRFGLAPIYTSFTDIYEAVMRMRQVIVERHYEKYPTERPEVT
ncbi:MAG: kynureninase [Anaerolineales bacterium]